MEPTPLPEFRILGPVEVVSGGRPVPVAGAKQRALLGVLLLHLNEVVPADQLSTALWGSRATAAAPATLRSHVAYLRRLLTQLGTSGSLLTRSPGYLLRLAPDQVDSYRFERLVADGQAALREHRTDEAAHLLRTGLALWRGQLLADLDRPAFAEAQAARLAELRLAALESRIEADLALGGPTGPAGHPDPAGLIGELEQLVRAHPLRERLCGQLMRALYQSGRQAEALAAYQDLRRRLADELGITPGPALRQLEKGILRHELDLAPAGGARREGLPPPGPAPVQVPAALLDMVRRGPFIGRDQDLAVLRDRWAEVVAGQRRVVLVAGEAGIGKSRLVAEFAHQVAPGAELLVGHCDQTSLVAYQPIAEALRGSHAVAGAVAVASSEVRTRLLALLGEATGRPARAAGSISPEPERFALFEAVVWVLAQLAATGPVLCVVEDLEQCDRASATLVRHLASAAPGRVLFVLTYRDPPGSKHPPLQELLVDLERRSGADQLALARFSEAELAVLVTATTGAESAAPFVQALWQHTGGNPFYATEVVRYVDAHASVPTGARFCQQPAGALELGVPAGVRNVLRHRLEGLSEPTRQLLACAAVIGGEVDFSLLEATLRVPDDELIAALDEATRTGLLIDAGGSWAAAYTFPHALVREAVYDDLPAARRQRLHLRVAQSLQDSGPPHAARLSAAAVHLRAAGPLADPEEAVALSLRAAESARELYAWDEAAAHAEAALALLATSGAPIDRRAGVAELAGTLRWVASADLGQAVSHFEDALDYYRRMADAPSMARVQSRLGVALTTHPMVMDIPRAMALLSAADSARPPDHPSWHIQNGIATAAIFGFRTDQLGAAAGLARRIAEDTGRRDRLGWSLTAEAYHRFYLGELAAARALHEVAWQTATELADPHLGWNAARVPSFHSVAFLADPHAGEQWCRRALAGRRLDPFLRQRHDLLDLLALAAGQQGNLAAAREAAGPLGPDAVVRRFLTLWDGDWEAAAESWAGALRADSAAGDLLDATLNATWLAGAHHLLGQDAAAVATLRQALSWCVAGPQMPAELMVRAELARILPTMGAVDEAAAQLARCEEILRAGEDWRGRAGHVALARATVAAAHADRELAASAYAAAAGTFTAFHLPWQQALAMQDWSRWLASTGALVEAEAIRSRAVEVYAAIGAGQRWHQRMPPAGAGPGAGGSGRDVLTDREREVLRLVATGLSDREIARRLVLSPHTVHRHMANIRTKLGQPSRAAAVAHATRHHLA